jgi:hypothetical protein
MTEAKKSKPGKKNETDAIVLTLKLFIVIIGGAILLISTYAFVFFVLAMLPSFTAIMIDRRMSKSASGTLCALNLTGCLPYIFKLWHSAEINATAQGFLTNFNVWAVIYLTTSMGWLLIWLLPQACSRVFEIRSVNKAKSLDDKLKALRELWGDEIAK